MCALRCVGLGLFLVCHNALALELTGRIVAISDGDTLTLLDDSKRQHKIRLADIDAPESKQAFGSRSKQSLAEVCFRREAQVVVQGKDRFGRVIGRTQCAGVDASAEQVRRGMAWVFVRYAAKDSPLFALEANAKGARLGLWEDQHAVPPWEWRSANRK